MLKNYDNDEIMASYGRSCTVWKAIREAKEAIRDSAVRLGNAQALAEVVQYQLELNNAVADLIEALEHET